MRPGQAAPEFRRLPALIVARAPGFNEAGAGCPGIHGLAALDSDGSLRLQ